MPLSAPVEITGNVTGAYAMKFKVQGVGDVDLLTLLDYLITSVESGGGQVYINSDWVIKGAPGITVSSSVAGTYEINVPEGKVLESVQTRIVTAGTELDALGNMSIITAWNTDDFNQGMVTALTPVVNFIDMDNHQLSPSELGITVTHAALIGATSTQIQILGSLTTPFSVKLTF